MMHHLITIITAADLGGMGVNLGKLIERAGGGVLGAVCGIKAVGHIATERHVMAVGLFIVAIPAAMFLFAPNTAQNLITSTANSIAH